MRARKEDASAAASKRDEHEIRNAPYLIEGHKIVRNYDLLPTTHAVDNNLILDYIHCETPEEAKRLCGWLWNAFAAGRVFQRAATRAATDAVNANGSYTAVGKEIKTGPGIVQAFKAPMTAIHPDEAEYWAAQLRAAYNAGAAAASVAAEGAK